MRLGKISLNGCLSTVDYNINGTYSYDYGWKELIPCVRYIKYHILVYYAFL